MPDDNQTLTGAPADELDLELSGDSQQSAGTGSTQQEEKQTPDKYKGKSVDDLIAMHQNAERRLSQQGNELGEIRRLADSLIGVRTADNAKSKPERKPVTVEALLENPDKALAQALEDSPVAQRAQAAEARVEQLEQNISQQSFASRFKDHKADLENPDFIDWIKKSPLRVALATAAYKNNFTAATGLWEMWEERNTLLNVKSSSADQQAADSGRQQRVVAARVEKNGSNEAPPQKTYSRAKLMDLRAKVADGDQAAIAKWNDPEFQTSLVKAYDEGRVR